MFWRQPFIIQMDKIMFITQRGKKQAMGTATFPHLWIYPPIHHSGWQPTAWRLGTVVYILCDVFPLSVITHNHPSLTYYWLLTVRWCNISLFFLWQTTCIQTGVFWLVIICQSLAVLTICNCAHGIHVGVIWSWQFKYYIQFQSSLNTVDGIDSVTVFGKIMITVILGLFLLTIS